MSSYPFSLPARFLQVTGESAAIHRYLFFGKLLCILTMCDTCVWYRPTDISLLWTEALDHGCRTISTSQLAQSVVSYPVGVRDAGRWGKIASCLTSSLPNALAACSDFRCMPVLFCKHINKLLIIFEAWKYKSEKKPAIYRDP